MSRLHDFPDMDIRRYRWRFIVAVWTPGIFWFRVFGYGVHMKDTTRHRLLFSERNGFCWRLVIGRWSFRLLIPDRLYIPTKDQL